MIVSVRTSATRDVAVIVAEATLAPAGKTTGMALARCDGVIAGTEVGSALFAVAAHPANPETRITAMAATALLDMMTSDLCAPARDFKPRAKARRVNHF